MASDLCAQEVVALKEKLGQECRVIKNVGDFIYVINIKPAGLDLAFTFQLTDSYPISSPEVIVRSNKMDAAVTEQLQQALVAKASSHLGDPVMETLVNHGKEWLTEQGISAELAQVTVTAAKKKGKQSDKHKKKQREKPQREPEEDTATEKKKPPMKTAEDVIKRVTWDENLPSEEFLVGYLDRFKGVMEKAFTAFSWEDVASVDYNVLAVPKHRIEYFKYKELKVWDKNDRTDNVFGSTGSGLTIQEVMKDYDQLLKQERTKKPKDSEAAASTVDHGDGVEIVLREGEGGLEKEIEAVWDNKMRPSHFVCMRVMDKEVVEGIAQMQKAISEVEPCYRDCCIKPAALHITLCTLGLDTQDQVVEACQVLRDAKAELSEMAKEKIKVTMDGVDHFHERVIYARVKHGPDFEQFVEHVRILLRQAGLDIRDNYEYVPHLTVMKTTRQAARQMKTMKIDPAIYQSFSDTHFGSDRLDQICLCEMNDQRRGDGFYLCSETVALSQ